MSTILDLINKYQESLSDAERKVFNSLTEEEKFSRLPSEFKERLLNEAMETVSKLNEFKNAPAIFPDMALPQQLSSDFIFSLNTKPLILSVTLIKSDKEAFKNSLIHFCSYIGSFIELNVNNPHITLRNINIVQAQLEAYTKLVFLASLYFDEEEWDKKFNLLKGIISLDFYFIQDSNNKDDFNKQYKDQNCTLWIDDWIKIVRLESNKIFINNISKKEQTQSKNSSSKLEETKMIISSTDCLIPYKDMTNLLNSGDILLGVDNSKVNQYTLSSEFNYFISGTNIQRAFRLWLIVAIIVILVSIYFSFTYNWWNFILGFGLASAIAAANKKALYQNLLDKVQTDAALYASMTAFGAILYNFKDSELAKSVLERYKK